MLKNLACKGLLRYVSGRDMSQHLATPSKFIMCDFYFTDLSPCSCKHKWLVDTLHPRQNSRHFADDNCDGFDFSFKSHGHSFAWVQLTISQHWFINSLAPNRRLYEQIGFLFTMHICATTQIARFMGLTWGPPGDDRTQVGPMLAPWTLLSG